MSDSDLCCSKQYFRFQFSKHLRTVTNEQRDNHAQLEQQITTLHSQLNDAHEELVNMRFQKEELELKAQSAEKAQIEEEKVKATEDKFQKLKLMYTQIRDQHVTLLRQVKWHSIPHIKLVTLFVTTRFFCSTVKSVNNWCKQRKMLAMPSNKKMKCKPN